MRMWSVQPALMCNQHLLGEHVELHMIVGALNRGISMTGYYNGGLVSTDGIVPRHTALVEEMTARGMKHQSPLPAFINPHLGTVTDGVELHRRCERCRAR